MNEEGINISERMKGKFLFAKRCKVKEVEFLTSFSC